MSTFALSVTTEAVPWKVFFDSWAPRCWQSCRKKWRMSYTRTARREHVMWHCDGSCILCPYSGLSSKSSELLFRLWCKVPRLCRFCQSVIFCRPLCFAVNLLNFSTVVQEDGLETANRNCFGSNGVPAAKFAAPDITCLSCCYISLHVSELMLDILSTFYSVSWFSAGFILARVVRVKNENGRKFTRKK